VSSALLAFALWAAVSAQADERAFVEIVPEHTTCVVHQRIRIAVRFGIDAGFLKSNVIQQFRQKLEVPVLIEAPWLDELAGAKLVARGKPANDRAALGFVLNGKLARQPKAGEVVRGGKKFLVVEVGRAFLPEAAGELKLEAPVLRLAYGTEFRDDFINGRVPVDRHDLRVTGKPAQIVVAPLPAAGRPPNFCGAVGDFRVRADADSSRVAIGQSLKLHLRIEGVGNLNEFEAPKLEFEGFHVLGQLEAHAPGRRTITYDLAPRTNVAEIPAISFSYFVPEAGYRTVATEPIRLVVTGTPEPGSATGSRRPVPGKNDIYGVKPVPDGEGDTERKLSPAILVLVLLVPFVIAIAVMVWLRKRGLVSHDSRAIRVTEATEALREKLGRNDGSVTDAFTAYLAAHIDCAPAAVIAPGLETRLAEHGVPAELAERTSRFVDSLVASRFGGDALEDPAGTARDLFDELEAVFPSHGVS